VTLNGVPIDGVTGQRFENATVVIDEKGDIHIEAKGYAVRGAGAPAARPAAPPAQPGAGAPAQPFLTRRFFLATEHAAPGTGLDVDVFVNARWIRLVKAGEPQVVMEITRYLRPGANKVVLAPKRVGPAGAGASLRIVIGEGNVGGDRVMIDAPLVEVTRGAADGDERTEEFAFEAR
jgi:hypothetical protein